MPWGSQGGTLPGPAMGGYPAGGCYPARGVPCWGGTLAEGVTLLGGYPAGGYPARGVPCRGVPCRGGTLPGVPCRGGTQLGQQKECSLHGGRYASCVHAGGLSCWRQLGDSFSSMLRLMLISWPIVVTWYASLPGKQMTKAAGKYLSNCQLSQNHSQQLNYNYGILTMLSYACYEAIGSRLRPIRWLHKNVFLSCSTHFGLRALIAQVVFKLELPPLYTYRLYLILFLYCGGKHGT